jgi:hypothetical protein
VITNFLSGRFLGAGQYYYTKFFYPTKLTISTGNYVYTDNVSAVTGEVMTDGANPVWTILGNRWYLTTVPNDSHLRYVQFPDYPNQILKGGYSFAGH